LAETTQRNWTVLAKSQSAFVVEALNIFDTSVTPPPYPRLLCIVEMTVDILLFDSEVGEGTVGQQTANCLV
jgi:hypothetical protein